MLAGLFAVLAPWMRCSLLRDGLAGKSAARWDVKAVSHIISLSHISARHRRTRTELNVRLAHVHNPIGVMNECWVRHLGTESGVGLHQMFRAVTSAAGLSGTFR